MTPSPRNRAIALAALFQACELVRQIAWSGRAELEPFDTCVGSVLALQAPDIEHLYGEVSRLRMGIDALVAQLAEAPQGRNVELTRYAVSVLHLERRLTKNSAMVAQLRAGLEKAQAQLEFFGPTHENMIARLAELYQQTISQIGPRIIVQGEQSHLSNPDNAAKIRSLLLAGIRAAVLWRQAGGNRWRLIFGRKQLLAEARALSAGA